MNRIIQQLEQHRKQGSKIKSIYCTAGYPTLEDTVEVLKQLETHGADMIEIGLPFSDPLADGPTIQKSSTQALKQGMTTVALFEQLEGIRNQLQIPLILMGYLNPMLQYGLREFCERCQSLGIDGLIIPDLPVEEYEAHYIDLFQECQLIPIFLITPQTSPERIRYIDRLSQGFIYMVSSASVTGSTNDFDDTQRNYFKRIEAMQLKTPLIVGFGIKDAQSFAMATEYAQGGIIGSAFIKQLGEHGISGISKFMNML